MASVTLTWQEVWQAACVGCLRRLAALRRARPEVYGALPLDAWGNDIEAAAAELALAKYLNQFWNAYAETPSELCGDAGIAQVRYTRRDNGCLILHDRDRDEAVFYLVTGSIPTFRIIGHIRAVDGKRETYLRNGDGRPAYFVPQEKLTPT